MTSGEKRARLAELIGTANGRYAAGNREVMKGQIREMIGLARDVFEGLVKEIGYDLVVQDETALSTLVARAEPIRQWRAECEKEDLKFPRKPQSEWPAEPEVDWEAP